MLMSTTTDGINQIGSVASSIFSDLQTPFYIVSGILIAVFVLELVLDILKPKNEDPTIPK